MVEADLLWHPVVSQKAQELFLSSECDYGSSSASGEVEEAPGRGDLILRRLELPCLVQNVTITRDTALFIDPEARFFAIEAPKMDPSMPVNAGMIVANWIKNGREKSLVLGPPPRRVWSLENILASSFKGSTLEIVGMDDQLLITTYRNGSSWIIRTDPMSVFRAPEVIELPGVRPLQVLGAGSFFLGLYEVIESGKRIVVGMGESPALILPFTGGRLLPRPQQMNPKHLRGLDITAIALGLNHAVLLSSDGEILSWGKNSSGQLGLGDLRTRSLPTVTRPKISKTFAPIAAAATDGTTVIASACGSLWVAGGGSSFYRRLPTIPFPVTSANQGSVRRYVGLPSRKPKADRFSLSGLQVGMDRVMATYTINTDGFKNAHSICYWTNLDGEEDWAVLGPYGGAQRIVKMHSDCLGVARGNRMYAFTSPGTSMPLPPTAERTVVRCAVVPSGSAASIESSMPMQFNPKETLMMPPKLEQVQTFAGEMRLKGEIAVLQGRLSFYEEQTKKNGGNSSQLFIELESEIRASKIDNQVLKTKLGLTETKLLGAEAHAETCGTNLKRSKETMESLREDLRAQVELCSGLHKRKSLFENNLTLLRRESDLLKSQRAEDQAALQAARKSVSMYEKTNVELQMQSDERTSQLEAANKQSDVLIEECNELREGNAELRRIAEELSGKGAIATAAHEKQMATESSRSSRELQLVTCELRALEKEKQDWQNQTAHFQVLCEMKLRTSKRIGDEQHREVRELREAKLKANHELEYMKREQHRLTSALQEFEAQTKRSSQMAEDSIKVTQELQRRNLDCWTIWVQLYSEMESMRARVAASEQDSVVDSEIDARVFRRYLSAVLPSIGTISKRLNDALSGVDLNSEPNPCCTVENSDTGDTIDQRGIDVSRLNIGAHCELQQEECSTSIQGHSLQYLDQPDCAIVDDEIQTQTAPRRRLRPSPVLGAPPLLATDRRAASRQHRVVATAIAAPRRPVRAEGGGNMRPTSSLPFIPVMARRIAERRKHKSPI